MEKWEKEEQIKVLKRDIEMLKAKKNRLNKEGYNINYNSSRGQKQSQKLQEDLQTIDDQIIENYSQLSELQRTVPEKTKERADYSLKVKRSTALRLKELGSAGDTIDKVIRNLIEFYDIMNAKEE